MPWTTHVLELYHSVSFAWRRATRLRLPGMVWVPTPRSELASPLPPEQQASGEAETRRLQETYGLQLPPTGPERLELLCAAELLEALLARAERPLPRAARVLEVGPASWSYAGVLHALLRHAGAEELDLVGLELDAHAPGPSGRSRRVEALAACHGLPGCRYLEGDGRHHTGDYDLVLMLYPLVLRSDALAWGLPGRHFDPVALLARCHRLVRPGGALLLATFAYEEAELRRQLDQARVSATLTPFTSALRVDREPRRLVISGPAAAAR